MAFTALFQQNSYAEGTHSVTVKFNPDGYTLDETTYKLYKVGTFGENGTFDFIEPYKDAIKEVPNYKEDDPEWSAKWLESAETVADYIKTEGIEPVDKNTQGDAGSRAGFQFTGLENGFYLVTGTSTRLNESGKVTYYWPRPMYIRILNDDPEYELKPANGTACVLRVFKQWVKDDKVKDETRPDSITLKVSYDGNHKFDIKLPHKGKWYFEWETEMGEDDPEKWAVSEVQSAELKKSYKVQNSGKFVKQSDLYIKTITNTYVPGPTPTPTPEPEPEPVPPTRVKTGDYSSIITYIVIFAAAAALLIFVIALKKKRK